MNDKRVVTNTRLHSKSLFFKSKLSSKLDLITGLNHYAQWGGDSPTYGKQLSSFKDYIKIVSGSSGGSDALTGDQINVLGNHLGYFLVQLNYQGNKVNWNFYWSHPFEDRSGIELLNYPDALYGFFIDFKKPKVIISKVLTEFTYTKHMSGKAPHYTDKFGIPHAASGRDNYFNHNMGVYGSGWTYYGNGIGSPFFTTNTKDSDGITKGIIRGDNRLMAFNIGIEGTINKISYKTIISHTTYFGWFGNEYDPKPQQFSGLFEINLPKSNLPIEITLGTAFDTGTYRSVNFGGFLKLTKKGNF